MVDALRREEEGEGGKEEEDDDDEEEEEETSYQLMADGFLSVHMLPLIATSTRSGNSSSKISIAFKHPLLTCAEYINAALEDCTYCCFMQAWHCTEKILSSTQLCLSPTHHVHSHGIARHAAEAEVHVSSSYSGVHAVETAVVCGGVECFLRCEKRKRAVVAVN